MHNVPPPLASADWLSSKKNYSNDVSAAPIFSISPEDRVLRWSNGFQDSAFGLKLW